MRWRIPIRSRVGNAVLAVLGVLYFLCAITLLGYSLMPVSDTLYSPLSAAGGAEGLFSRCVATEQRGQFRVAAALGEGVERLAAIALGGVVFINVAVDNLQLRERVRPSAPGSPDRRRVAAARP